MVNPLHCMADSCFVSQFIYCYLQLKRHLLNYVFMEIICDYREKHVMSGLEKIIQSKYKEVQIKKYTNAGQNGKQERCVHTTKNAIPIKAYKKVHTIPKTQFGGVQGAFLNVLYQYFIYHKNIKHFYDIL